jgi:post-segregation antitoxin (ccd killing protein)
MGEKKRICVQLDSGLVKEVKARGFDMTRVIGKALRDECRRNPGAYRATIDKEIDERPPE